MLRIQQQFYPPFYPTEQQDTQPQGELTSTTATNRDFIYYRSMHHVSIILHQSVSVSSSTNIWPAETRSHECTEGEREGSPASREKSAEAFSILAFLSAGGAGHTAFTGGGAKLAGPADEAVTLSTWPFVYVLDNKNIYFEKGTSQTFAITAHVMLKWRLDRQLSATCHTFLS